jgi:hypothetical protein
MTPHAMTRAVAVIVVATVCGAPVVITGTNRADARQSPQTPPVFRTGTDLVTVPVSIRSQGVSLTGLTPDDFVVTDNGVRQVVQVISGESVPADVTLVVETSEAIGPYVKSIEGQVRKIASMMRPDDRFEVVGAADYVTEILPLRPARAQTTIPALTAGGLSSINDALVGALLREPDASRPHLIIVLSDTIDTMSATSMETVRNVAKYSSSILTIAWITMDLLPAALFEPPFARATAERFNTHVAAATFVGEPAIQLYGGISEMATGSFGSDRRTQPRTGGWHPHYDPPVGRHVTAFDPLKEAAEMTGGKLYLPGVFADRTASVIFDKLYSDYRHRYVIQYNATGVVREGWHDIRVTVPKAPKAEIGAKRGYLVEKK